MGIFLWLVGFWFFSVSTLAILTGLKQMRFDLTWWAFIFPNSGLTVAAIQIGEVLDSQPIRDVTSAMTILVSIAWVGVALATIWAIARRKVLYPRDDKDR